MSISGASCTASDAYLGSEHHHGGGEVRSAADDGERLYGAGQRGVAGVGRQSDGDVGAVGVAHDGDAHAVLPDSVLDRHVADEVQHALPRAGDRLGRRVQQKRQLDVASRALVCARYDTMRYTASFHHKIVAQKHDRNRT